MLIVLGVLLPVFTGSLDGTILASALPSTGRQLGDVHNLPWLITAYLIASTSVTTLYGKISDIHGRRTTRIISISMYMLGSPACVLAPNMFVLILGRVLHGLGGGGLTSTGMVVLGDIAAPKDRGKCYGYFSATYTTAGACGPAFGGFLAEYFHWKVIFWINIPMGIIALFLVLTLLKRLPRHEQSHKLDFLGASLIMSASVAFMLALSMGGVRYPWTSPPILAVRPRLRDRRGFRVAAAHRAGAAYPAGVLLQPGDAACDRRQRIRLGRHRRAAHLPADLLAEHCRHDAVRCGLERHHAGDRTERQRRRDRHHPAAVTHYKVIPAVGLTVAIAALIVLAWRARDVSLLEFQILLAIIGAGFGGMPPLSATVLQNSVSISTFGTAVATMQFWRNLYCTMMVAAFGAVVLTGPLEAGATGYSVEGFVRIFYVAAASFALSLLAVLLVEAKPLQTTHA